jgi:hypothetical protein
MENRIIANYLPQFHPIPENDLWWGKGFTEWTNVVKAKPLYKGHNQPQLPADLGFYDLRLNDIMIQQAELARSHGVYGFCYYHYWFNGKRLLEKPIDTMLNAGSPDFPFMLCWANENWTRRWDGFDDQVLMRQEYSEDDDLDHIQFLVQYFEDNRYIKVDGKPVLVIYRPWLMPNPSATAEIWREYCHKIGINLYLCHMVFGYGDGWDTLIPGFDAAIDFEPFGIRRPKEKLFSDHSTIQELFRVDSFFKSLLSKCGNQEFNIKKLNIKSYESMFNSLRSLHDVPFKCFPSLCPGWDNTARRGSNPSLILHDNSPVYFEEWYKKVINDFKPFSSEENLVFINAWNEWAEGNHLEPCNKYGLGFLNSLKNNL